MRIVIKILWFLSMSFLFLFAVLPLSEWWIIGFEKNYDGYAFGLINENSWFYETPELYANVMLTEGLVQTTFISLSIYFFFKKEYKKSNYLLLFFFISFLLALINVNFF